MSALAELWTTRRRFFLCWTVAILAAAGTFAMSEVAVRTLERPHPLAELSYYPTGSLLRPMTLGHAETAADLAWLRAVQYYGAHRQSDNEFRQMGHVFDVLTTLAPRFTSAYVFGAFALAQEGADFPAADRLMQRGLEANPRSGDLAFQAGFLYYVKPGGRDLKRAAEYFEIAALQPDAPPQAVRFAAFTRQVGGQVEVAYALWAEIAEHSPNPHLRQMAERQMARIREAVEQGRREDAIRRLPTPRVRVGH